MTYYPDYEFLSTVEFPERQDEPAYWFLFQENRLVVQEESGQEESGANGQEVAAIPQAIDPVSLGLHPIRRQFLGYLRHEGVETACYAGELDPTKPLPDGLKADNLRQLYTQVGDMWFELAGRAVQIVAWDSTHQFCGRCGAPMQHLTYERAKRCNNCGLTNYPRIAPAIIIAVTRETGAGRELLLARNHRFPPGRYSVVAGFVEPGETLEECCAREVYEEVRIKLKNIRYFASQPWPFPNSLMLGFTADYAEGEIQVEEEEIAEAGWFRPENMPLLPPRPSIARRLIDTFIAENG